MYLELQSSLVVNDNRSDRDLTSSNRIDFQKSLSIFLIMDLTKARESFL